MPMAFDAPVALAGDEVPRLTIHNCDHEAEVTVQEVDHDGDQAEESKEDGTEDEPASEPAADEPADQPAEADQPADDPANAELQAVAKVQQVAEADDTFWAEISLMGELAEAERDCQHYEHELLRLTEERKDIKKSYEAAILRVRDVAAEINDLIKGKSLPIKAKVVASQAEQPATGPAAQGSGDDDEWRSTPTRKLLDGIKGMGGKKLDAISDAAPTAGDLEDLRAEASKAHKQFKDVLPQGFGDKVAQAIEDRLLDHVANHNTPSCAEQVEPRAEVEVEFHKDASLDRDPEQEPSGPDALLAEIAAEAEREGWSLGDTNLTEEDSAATVLGYRAFQEGRPHDDLAGDCQGDSAKERDWMTGWVLARLRMQLLTEDEATGGEETAEL